MGSCTHVDNGEDSVLRQRWYIKILVCGEVTMLESLSVIRLSCTEGAIYFGHPCKAVNITSNYVEIVCFFGLLHVTIGRFH